MRKTLNNLLEDVPNCKQWSLVVQDDRQHLKTWKTGDFAEKIPCREKSGDFRKLCKIREKSGNLEISLKIREFEGFIFHSL